MEYQPFSNRIIRKVTLKSIKLINLIEKRILLAIVDNKKIYMQIVVFTEIMSKKYIFTI